MADSAGAVKPFGPRTGLGTFVDMGEDAKKPARGGLGYFNVAELEAGRRDVAGSVRYLDLAL
jgi:hypothetical protein